MNLPRIAVLLSAIAPAAMFGQSLISASSGMVNYVEGDVLAGGRSVEPQNGRFASWKKGEELVAKEGRAEILLTPGAFLRVSENTRAVLVENRLSDTRVQLLEGSVILECAELLQDNAVTLSFNGHNIAIRKPGLYRLDSEPASVKVFEGELQIAGEGQTLTLRKGKAAQLGKLLTAEKFDVKTNDSFFRWAARRAEPLSVASFSSARSAYSSGMGTGGGCAYGNWLFNSYYGMFTYIPCSGFYMSPFGYRFYSPGVVNRIYYSMMNPWGGGGVGSNGFNTGGNNGINSWNRDSYFDGSRGYDVGSRGSVGFNTSSGSMSTAPAQSLGTTAPTSGGRGDVGGGGAGSSGGRGDSGAGGRGK